ncbi:glucans biosynthesis protein MdoC [Amnibacterium soli]|uniref:Glucans biosynthesis protein MdoC n=1 Tax=Amnibacterium soli TaxID=1282736 RepID=A0ABP8ZCS2_9MICO
MSPGSSTSRLHHLDALRALLILLGIPFHASLAFSPTHWVMNMPQTATPFWWFAEFLHLWRMPSFFFVAGLFATWVLARRGSLAWFRLRVVRLGLPLVAGVLLINVPTALLLGLADHSPYLDAGATFANGVALAPLVQHLWFLIVLLVFSAAHVLIRAVVRRTVVGTVHSGLVRGKRTMFKAASGVRPALYAGILVAAVVCVLVLAAAWDTVPTTFSRQDVFGNAGAYAAFYLFGSVVALKSNGIERLSHAPLVPVLGSVVALAGTYGLLTTSSIDAEIRPVTAFFRIALSCMMLLALLALARRFASSESARIRVVVGAALVIYLIHQPVIVVTELVLAPTGLPLLLEYAITLLSAVVCALAFYALVRRNRITRLLFAGSTRPLPATRGLFAIPVRSRVRVLAD